MAEDPSSNWQDAALEHWQPQSTEGWLNARWHSNPKIQQKLTQTIKDCQMAGSAGSPAMAMAQDFVLAVGLSKSPPFFKGQIDKSKPPILVPRIITDIKLPSSIVKKAERKYLKQYDNNLLKAIDRVSDKFRIRVHFNDTAQVLAAEAILAPNSPFRKRWEAKGVRFVENAVTNHFQNPKSYGHVGLDLKFEIQVNGRCVPCELQLMHEQMLLTDAMTHTTYENDRDIKVDKLGGPLDIEEAVSSEMFHESLMNQYLGDIIRLHLYKDLVGQKYSNPDRGFLKELEKKSTPEEYKEYLEFMTKLVTAVTKVEAQKANSPEAKQKIWNQFIKYKALLEQEQERLMSKQLEEDLLPMGGVLPSSRRAQSRSRKQMDIILPSRKHMAVNGENKGKLKKKVKDPKKSRGPAPR